MPLRQHTSIKCFDAVSLDVFRVVEETCFLFIIHSVIVVTYERLRLEEVNEHGVNTTCGVSFADQLGEKRGMETHVCRKSLVDKGYVLRGI